MPTERAILVRRLRDTALPTVSVPAIRNARTIVALPYPAVRAMKRRITHARKSPDAARPTANVLHTKSASAILVPSKRAQNRDIRHPARRDTRKTALPRVPTARAIPVRRFRDTALPTVSVPVIRSARTTSALAKPVRKSIRRTMCRQAHPATLFIPATRAVTGNAPNRAVPAATTKSIMNGV